MSEIKESEDPVDALFKKYGFKREKMEMRNGNDPEPTNFVEPVKRYRMWFQSENHNLEEMYYWCVGSINGDFGLHHMEKITDVFSASTGSSIFGDMQARLGAQQQQVQQLMATIGKMVKDLFALVRELRQIDERLGYYKDAQKDGDIAKSAEITLRGLWIDLVEGGSQNPSSVLGLAQQVGYSILPDLFFNAPPMEISKVESYVDKLEFNSNVKNMLRRKLTQFLTWKKTTYTELKTKKNFQIRYLAQHFDSIRMYISWVKPYIRQVQSLQMASNENNGVMKNQADMDSGYLVNAFQGSLVEVETLLHTPRGGGYHSVVLLHMFYRTQPSMDFHAKDAWQQKGPIHIGRTEMTIRTYGWTKQQIEDYKKMKTQSDWDMLMSIDQSLIDAMELLGDDLVNYLKEAGKELPEGFGKPRVDKQKEEAKKKEEAKSNAQMGFADPLLSAGNGLTELFGALIPFKFDLDAIKNLSFSKKEKEAMKKLKNDKAQGKAAGWAGVVAWQTYKNYKKAHGMITW